MNHADMDSGAEAADGRTNDGRPGRPLQTKRHPTAPGRSATRLAERTRELLVARGSLRIAAAERRRLEDQLRQAGKLASAGHLASGLAHDLNNLLGVVMCSLEMMGRRIDAGSADGLARYLSNAVTSTERAAALSRRLLDFARPRPSGAEPIDPARLICGWEDLFPSVAGSKVDFVIKTDARSWPILCDPDELSNAVLNLVINARDAMPAGGRLILRIANRRLDEAAARAIGGGLAAGDFVTISVTDTGAGIAPEVLSKVFEPFFTTKGGHGTGLGLAMVRSFARQTGGHVQLESEPGQGSTFRFYLPRCAACGPCTCGDAAVSPAVSPAAVAGPPSRVVAAPGSGAASAAAAE
jgi:signal transduction histidine kinase